MTLSLLPRDQEPHLQNAGISRAAQACTTCRKQKRKCDKALPACSRCASLQRLCDYSESLAASAAPTAEAFASLQTKLAEIEAKLDATKAAAAHHPPPRRPGGPDTPGSSTLAGGSESSPGDVVMGDANSSGDLWMDSQAEQPFIRNRFPGVLFLHSDVFKWAGVAIPKPSVDIPMGVLEILAPSNAIEDAASTYFNTVHRWFPFISRKRMNLGFSLHDGGPDLALLFLSMKLITTAPNPDMASAADTHLYTASKHFLALLESAGTASILYLQAMILIALYEFGHGIYPAAWMTIGSCVRYASMLGLPSYQETSKVLGQCTTWTEAEERRRVWWAVHILDRAVSIGSMKPFAGSPDPPPDTEFLPVDDLAWDAGDMARSLQRPVGTRVDERGGGFSPFARLAQASVLTSKAMAHCKRAASRYVRSKSQKAGGGGEGSGPDGVGDEKSLDVKEATDVIVEMKTLCEAITADIADGGGTGSDAYFALAPSRALLWSTTIMVLDLYSCPEHMRPAGVTADESRTEGELAMQVEAINGLTTASRVIRRFAGELLAIVTPAASPGGGRGADGVGEGLADRVSPLCLDALYSALATFHWQWKESGQPEMKEGMDETRAALVRVAPRWRLASEFLDIERHHGVTITMAVTRANDI